MNEQLRILTCGSVDDGKSTLIGHLLYDCKTLYTDQIETLKLDSKINSNGNIDYSLLLDGLDEEREQKITIDIAYRYFNTKKRSFIVLDAPGHEEYTRNMAVGASQADIAIILIDATKGVLSQTKRHMKICSMMGIKDYVVVINKMDLVEYSEEKYTTAKKEVEELFKEEKINSIEIIPISATNGDNISSISQNMKWYKGDYLINYLENINIFSQNNDKFIMPIQMVNRPNQFFRGYQGNVISGQIKVGDEIICYPSKEKANIKELYNTNQKVDIINKGEAVTVVLDKEIDISRGCVLSNDNIENSSSINVDMLWMDDEPLKIENSYYINIATMNSLCYIKRINYIVDINSENKQIEFEEIHKNDIINCDIEIIKKVPVTRFDYNKELGSLILINRLTNSTSACAVIKECLNNNNLFYHKENITSEDRKKILSQNPVTIWFTGLSSSGKSTIANELDKILYSEGFNTMLLDGDNIRLGLNKDLNFSNEDRIENIRRISEVAKLMNDAGLICITAFISPLEINREMAKSIIGDKFILVYINTPLEECEKRDKKGLYKKARSGQIKDFTGISSPFDIPKNADIILENNDYKKCAKEIYNKIIDRIKV